MLHRKKWLLHLATSAGIIIFFLISAELILRNKGYQPWNAVKPDIKISPGNKAYMRHPELGYTHIPGKFKVTIAGSYTFNVTHLDNTLRITHPPDTYQNSSTKKEELWIFGNSFTHGWSVNDKETFAWLLQERFPEYEVVNFGVSGYGLIQALLQFKKALHERGAPRLAILDYSSFDDQINTFLRVRRKAVAPWVDLGPQVQPYARLDKTGGLHFHMAKREFTEFPFMRISAFSHFLEIKYNEIEDRLFHSHEVTKALMQVLHQLCKQHSVNLSVAGLSRDPLTLDMLEFAKSEGIPTTDIWVDLSIKENNNSPYDAHPSAVAHRQYADKLETFIRNTYLSDSQQVPDIQNRL